MSQNHHLVVVFALMIIACKPAEVDTESTLPAEQKTERRKQRSDVAAMTPDRDSCVWTLACFNNSVDPECEK